MQKPPLTAYLANVVIAPAVKKAFLGGPYVSFGSYIASSQILYETGTICGLLFRERMAIFVKLFCEPGRESEFLMFIREAAGDILRACADEPAGFIDLFARTEITFMMDRMRQAGLTKLSDWLDSPQLVNHKIDLTNVFQRLQIVAVEGIGLGSQYAEIAERLWKKSYQDPAESELFRRFGLPGADMPQNPLRTVSFENRKREVLSLVKSYVSEARPDLLGPLELFEKGK